MLNKYTKEATELDKSDVLKDYRHLFVSAGDNVIYLDGNSLGKLPKAARERVETALDREWGERMIRSWNDSWWDMPSRAASLVSGLIGAGENEVMVCDSTSLNLYKLATAALKLQKGRKKIISEEINFPTDLYVLQGVINQLDDNHQLILAESTDGLGIDVTELDRLIDSDTALVVLSMVSFKSASMYDIKRISDLAHKNGALIIWDLCHAVGAVPVDLNAADADMAVGCTYKYLNCGPGSPAFLYVREDLQNKLNSPVWGWFGHMDPFDFSLEYKASASVKKFMSGTSGILSMCTIEPSLNIIRDAGIDRIRDKSIKMTDFFIRMYNDILAELGYLLGSPEKSDKRGSHISLKHPDAYRISKALIDPVCGSNVIIPDFRPPDYLRFGFAPLYNTFSEIVSVVEELQSIVKENKIESYSPDREDVT